MHDDYDLRAARPRGPAAAADRRCRIWGKYKSVAGARTVRSANAGYPTGCLSPSSIRTKGVAMNIHLTLGPLVALIAGILILIVPRLLNFIVALYLIIIGLIGLWPHILWPHVLR